MDQFPLDIFNSDHNLKFKHLVHEILMCWTFSIENGKLNQSWKVILQWFLFVSSNFQLVSNFKCKYFFFQFTWSCSLPNESAAIWLRNYSNDLKSLSTLSILMLKFSFDNQVLRLCNFDLILQSALMNFSFFNGSIKLLNYFNDWTLNAIVQSEVLLQISWTLHDLLLIPRQ